MQQLSSNNYETVDILLRGEDKIFEMPVDTGLRLMNYLTTDAPRSHVMLTDIRGRVVVVRVNDIMKIEPIIKHKRLEDYT